MRVIASDEYCWAPLLGELFRGQLINFTGVFPLGGDNLVLLCRGARYKVSRGNPGTYLKKLRKPAPATMMLLDGRTGKVLARHDLPRLPRRVVRTPGNREIALFFPYRDGGRTVGSRSKKSPLDAELLLFDSLTLETRARVSLPGTPTTAAHSADKLWVYAFDPGSPSDKVEFHRAGAVIAIPTTGDPVPRLIPVASEPNFGMDALNGDIHVSGRPGPGEGGGATSSGIVQIVRDRAVVEEYTLDRVPLFFQHYPLRQRLVVMTEKRLVEINTTTGEKRRMDFPARPALVGPLLPSRDFLHAYLVLVFAPEAGPVLAEVDLFAGTVGEVFNYGSTSTKLARRLTAAGLGSLIAGGITSSMSSASSLGDIGSTAMRNSSLQSLIIEAAMLVGASNGVSRLRWDAGGQRLFAIHPASEDLTMIDPANENAIAIVDGVSDARGISLLPSSGLLAVQEDEEGLAIVDPVTLKVLRSERTGGNFFLAGDGKLALALSQERGAVYLLDSETLEILSSTAVEKPVQAELQLAPAK
jgi:hypothetical protein